MENLAGYIATGITSFVVGAVLMYIRPKAKIVFWSPHSFRWRLGPQQNNLELQTDIWTIQNIGRLATSNLDIVFAERPDHYQLQPSITYESITLDNGHFVLRVPELGPKEFVSIQVLSFQKLPQPLTIKSDVGLAQSIPIRFQKVQPRWITAIGLFFLLVGLGTTLFWAIVLLDSILSCAGGCAA